MNARKQKLFSAGGRVLVAGVLIYALAFLLRFLYWRVYGECALGYIDADGLSYYRNAYWLRYSWDELFFSYQWHRWGGWLKAPLYYVFLAAGSMVVGEAPASLRLVQVLIDSGTAVLVFGLARELFGFRAGVTAGIVYAVFYEFVMLPCSLVTETPFLFMCTATFWVLVRALSSPSQGRFAAGGALAGVAALFRPIVLPFMPVVALWSLVQLRRQRYGWERSLAMVAVLTAATCAPTVPWMIRNSALVGKPFGLDNMGGLNIMLSHAFPELDEWGVGPAAYMQNRRAYRRRIWNWPSLEQGVPISARRVAQVAFEPSVRNARTVVNKAQQILRPALTRLYYNTPARERFPVTPPTPAIAVLSDILFLCASFLALVGIASRCDRRSVLLVFWIFLQVFLLTVVFRPTPNYHMRRYSLPFMVAALPFIYPGLAALRRRAGTLRQAAAAALVIVWLALVVPPLVRWCLGKEVWVHRGLESMVDPEGARPTE